MDALSICKPSRIVSSVMTTEVGNRLWVDSAVMGHRLVVLKVSNKKCLDHGRRANIMPSHAARAGVKTRMRRSSKTRGRNRACAANAAQTGTRKQGFSLFAARRHAATKPRRC
jgi:hypothetical protein